MWNPWNLLRFLTVTFEIGYSWFLAHCCCSGIIYLNCLPNSLTLQEPQSNAHSLQGCNLCYNVIFQQHCASQATNSWIQTPGQVRQRINLSHCAKLGPLWGRDSICWWFVWGIHWKDALESHMAAFWHMFTICAQFCKTVQLLIKLLTWGFNDPLMKPLHAPVSSAAKSKVREDKWNPSRKYVFFLCRWSLHTCFKQKHDNPITQWKALQVGGPQEVHWAPYIQMNILYTIHATIFLSLCSSVLMALLMWNIWRYC